jgi:hypothetical protein
MIYKVLPDVEIKWHDVWVGAVLTAILFLIGQWGLGLYLGRQSTDSTTSAAGALPMLLLWVYYTAQILFFGAEFTQVYANKYGSHIQPSPHAVAVTEEARAQQGMPRREDLERAAGKPDGRAQSPGRNSSGGAPALTTAVSADGLPAAGAQGSGKNGTAQHNAQHNIEDAAAVMTGVGLYLILSRIFKRDKGE